MIWLRQSTARTVPMGPALDDTDGKTPEAGLTISQADIQLSKNGGAFAQTNNAAGATAMGSNGYYGVPLDTTDTATLGHLKVEITESGALPFWDDFMVIPQQVWDSLFSTDKLQVDAVEISNDSTAANNLELDYDGTGYAKPNSTIGTSTANTDMRGTDSASTHSAADAADAVWNELSTGHTDAGKAGQQLWTDVDAILADSGELQTNQGNWTTATGFSTHSAAEAADAVWNELSTGHTDAGKAGQQLWTDIDAVLADTGELQTNQGNWTTATGFSTHSAADVWAAVTRTLTAATNITSTGSTVYVDANGYVQIEGTANQLDDLVGADSDTLETLSDQIDSVPTADIYHAHIELTIDGTNSQDEWTVTWFKNGVRITSGITVPKIQVVKRADGTDLIAATAMTEIGSTESFKYDATTTSRTSAGEAVVAIATATIDAATRTWVRPCSRDSS